MITEIHAKKVIAALEALRAARAHRKAVNLKAISVNVTVEVKKGDGWGNSEKLHRPSGADAEFGRRIVAVLRRDADDRVVHCERTLRQLDAEIPPETSHGSA